MQKYKVTAKLKKTRQCSYYSAVNLISGEAVTIKKLSGGNNWDELLKKKEVAMMKQPHYPFLARIKQIVKENGKFFVVHEELTQCVDDLKKKSLSLAEATNIGRQLIEIVMQLRKEQVMLYDLRPEFFFVNKKRVKLAYVISHDETSSEVEPPDYKYFAPEMTLNSNAEEVLEESSVFALGCIICELLLGKPLIQAKNKLDYMYIICGLYPKQKIDSADSQMAGSTINEPTKTFENVMEPVCTSHELIDLLGDMTRVNYRYRLKLEEALRRMKNLHVKFEAEEKDRSLSKRRAMGNSMNSSSIIERMTKRVEEVSRERDRYRQSPQNQMQTHVQTPLKSTKIISTNHEINLSLDNDLYERIGFMPPIPKECQPLRIEKNVQDNASFSTVTRDRNMSDLLIPVSNQAKSSLPMIATKQPTGRQAPTKPANYNSDFYRTGKEPLQQVQTRRKKPSVSMRVKTEEPSQLQDIQPQVALANRRNRKPPQLTNYAINNNNHLGLEMSQQDFEFGSESDFG